MVSITTKIVQCATKISICGWLFHCCPVSFYMSRTICYLTTTANSENNNSNKDQGSGRLKSSRESSYVNRMGLHEQSWDLRR